MSKEEEKSDLPKLPALQAMGRLATADALIDDIFLRELPEDKVNVVAHSPAPQLLSAEEYARQQDLQARLSGEANPYFD